MFGGIKRLAIFTKGSSLVILDVWIDSKHTFVFWKYLKTKDFVISLNTHL